MKSLYDYIKKQAEKLKTDENFGHFSKPFDDFMEKYPNYEDFNDLSEEDFSKKWAERKTALENPKKMEEKKVNSSVFPTSEKIFTVINAKIINATKDKKENEINDKNENKNKETIAHSSQTQPSGIYLMKWILIILGLCFIGGGIGLFFVAPTLAFKILAIGLGILGVAGFGFGLFYNKIGDYYRKKPESCCISFLTYTIWEPKHKTKEINMNLEKEKNDIASKDENVFK